MIEQSGARRRRLRARRLVFRAAAAWAGTLAACTPFTSDPVDAGRLPPPAADERVGDGSGAPAPSDGGGSEPSLACDPHAPFGAPTLVQGLAGLGSWVGGVALSPDYMTAYFFLNGRPDSLGNSDLYWATRPSRAAPFGPPSLIGGNGINTADFELDPTVSGQLRMLVFSREEQANDPASPHQIYYATRTSPSGPFAYQGELPVVNDPSALDGAPFLREDGQVLYFTSNRAGSGLDIYRATWNGVQFVSPAPVAELNTSFDDSNAVVTPDDLAVYFASNRPDGDPQPDGNPQNAGHIWSASRTSPSVSFSAPVSVAELNSVYQLNPTFVTRDQCELYFTINNPSNPSTIIAAYVAARPSP